MAIEKEIWTSTIAEGFWADNQFITRSFNGDAYVNNKKCHIPNAGAPSKVKKNRTELPATASKRTDVDVDFDLDEYTTDPINISEAEKVTLNYDKRNSVISGDKKKLAEEAAQGILLSWMGGISSGRKIKTTGEAVPAHTPSATGNRKSFCKEDVETIVAKFDSEDIPQVGRCLMIDAIQKKELLASLTNKESEAFYSGVDVKTGVIGKLLGVDIYMRSRVGVCTSAGVIKGLSAEGAATDDAVAIAWYDQAVVRALGAIKMFNGADNPLFYGDIYSFLVRAGGVPRYKDHSGVLLIISDKAE